MEVHPNLCGGKGKEKYVKNSLHFQDIDFKLVILYLPPAPSDHPQSRNSKKLEQADRKKGREGLFVQVSGKMPNKI